MEESFVLVEDSQGEFVALLQEALDIHRVAGGLDAALLCEQKLRVPEKGKIRWCNDRGYYGVVKACSIRHFQRSYLVPEIVKAAGEKPWMSLRDWCALSWYHVVDSHDLKHFQAGVTVERVESVAGVSYCAKAYLSKVDAESVLSEIEFGRSWGIFNRVLVPWAKIIEMDLSPCDGVRIRRIARHYLEHRLGRRVKRPYGVTLYCDTSQWSRLLAVPPDTPF
jgi:hypothetical protein